MVRFLLGFVCVFAVVWLLLGREDGSDLADISGSIRVIDGDTLDIGDTRIRLFGIDAVEREQSCRTDQGVDWACGRWVSQQVFEQFQGRLGTCAPTGDMTYGRVVARCFVDDVDIQQTLVRQGLAFAYRRYASDYVADERAAAAGKRGLWSARASGGVTSPAEFRSRRAARG